MIKILSGITAFALVISDIFAGCWAWLKDKWEWAVIYYNDCRYFYFNPKARAVLEECRRELADPNKKRYDSVEELIADILAEPDEDEA